MLQHFDARISSPWVVPWELAMVAKLAMVAEVDVVAATLHEGCQSQLQCRRRLWRFALFWSISFAGNNCLSSGFSFLASCLLDRFSFFSSFLVGSSGVCHPTKQKTTKDSAIGIARWVDREKEENKHASCNIKNKRDWNNEHQNINIQQGMTKVTSTRIRKRTKCT